MCHVFYAMDALWLGLFVGLVVACLFCFGLPAVSAVVRACVACVWWWVWWVGWVMVFLSLLFVVLFGEFDPGSGRTLAACLTHASRTGLPGFGWVGEWRTGE